MGEKHATSANGATHGPPPRRPAHSSIPHVTLIEFDLILAQELAILLLEGFCPRQIDSIPELRLCALASKIDVFGQTIDHATNPGIEDALPEIDD